MFVLVIDFTAQYFKTPAIEQNEVIALFNSIIKRAIRNRKCMRSNLIETVFSGLGHTVSRYTTVQVHLNSEYWGSYSLRERLDEEFMELTLGLDGTDYIYLKDVDGRYQYVNKKTEEGLGLPMDQIIGKTHHDFYPKEMIRLPIRSPC